MVSTRYYQILLSGLAYCWRFILTFVEFMPIHLVTLCVLPRILWPHELIADTRHRFRWWRLLHPFEWLSREVSCHLLVTVMVKLYHMHHSLTLVARKIIYTLSEDLAQVVWIHLNLRAFALVPTNWFLLFGWSATSCGDKLGIWGHEVMITHWCVRRMHVVYWLVEELLLWKCLHRLTTSVLIVRCLESICVGVCCWLGRRLLHGPLLASLQSFCNAVSDCFLDFLSLLGCSSFSILGPVSLPTLAVSYLAE